MKKKVVNPKYAKGKGEYEKVIRKIENQGECPFCPENFKYHKKPILKRSGTWLLTENSWPYKNSKYHFLMINTVHKELFQELTEKDLSSLKALTNWAIKKYDIKGGAFALRFGDTDHTGATVCHIHAHIISPKIDKKRNAKTVSFPIG